MVVLKGGGETYTISNGRYMEWEDVPETFKQSLREQTEIKKCAEMRAKAQTCIEEKGFWAQDCVGLTEAFHTCQSLELARTRLTQTPPTAT
ncbi:hypothetical protein AGDE_02956 [Angomonas deanei]|uniref:Uncharacterized protein n=1 Tax=Angomonas deanei TaxID=59799 RepID=A0A7G2CT39_9TRYP|nr:hypothetical protein AGDE_02956 [Angomonas deanei]CAD2222407.1 hypothetical protein, conserved [Angomonas deanei]|eukprot:EPY40969.1 hypothetical protein AGDE_02956 [Angomonas deanei]